MIEVEGLTKYYGDFRALGDVSFKVDDGQILAFLGPNGAGKSTTMKILTGYIAPTRGTARIGDRDVVEDSLAVRRAIGYLPETTPLYYDLQVDEFLRFAARLHNISRGDRAGRLGWVSEICGLASFWKKPIGVLSRGQKQRVGFAQAIMHDPDVLILDEPTAGLDPNQIIEVRRLIKEFAEYKTIILSTHILQEVDAMCERIVVIDQGQIVADSTAAALKADHGDLESAFHALTRPAEPELVAAAAEPATESGTVEQEEAGDE
ncbi:MAG: ABC transporter ATP-binding protein [Planctomycetota bacterium]|jgi:ABC-2 type transport system ATP-binding protein